MKLVKGLNEAVAAANMKVLEDLISALNTDAKVRDIRLGLFHTAVLARNCGLAATLPRDALQQDYRDKPLKSKSSGDETDEQA